MLCYVNVIVPTKKNSDPVVNVCTNCKCALFFFLCSFCRSVGFWLNRAQSLLYCNEHGVLGSFSEEVKSCSCQVEQPNCQGVIPCVLGTSSTSCLSCATDNATRCGSCHHGNLLHFGSCRPSIAASLDHYLNFDLDMPDAEVSELLLICISLALEQDFSLFIERNNRSPIK